MPRELDCLAQSRRQAVNRQTTRFTHNTELSEVGNRRQVLELSSQVARGVWHGKADKSEDLQRTS